MLNGINISSDHFKTVATILKKILADNSRVWVFGSRLKKVIKPYSDLDLAIDCLQQSLTIEMLADLREAFEESDLPYKVDIVDMNRISPGFLSIINADKVLFDFDAPQP
jgi:predicted nucleotidyltransferase